MITYQPAFDPYHAAFRLLRLRDSVAKCDPIERDRLRILDFFVSFPFLLEGVRFRPEDRSFRTVAKSYRHLVPFADLPEATLLFEYMELPHRTAVESLVRLEWMMPDEETGRISFNDELTIQAPLAVRVDEINREQSDLMNVLETLACEYEFLGADGLKGRTGLMEYRYDTI